MRYNQLLKTRQAKIIFLFFYVILACLIVLLLKPYYLFSIMIVLVPPSLLNFLWLKKSRTKILLFSVFSTLLLALPVELASRLANVWDVQSVFPRPFGLIPLENMLFAFINLLWVLSFYEFFTDRDGSKLISKKIKYLIGLYCLWAAIIYIFYFYNKNLIALNYFQMAVPVLVIPSAIIFIKKPGLLRKTILPTIFFAVVFFVYEIVSLKIGSWWWPGAYLLSFQIDGGVFPLDDVIIWYFLSTPALIGGYEFFADDWK